MSPQESRTLWCLVKGYPQPYDVFDIPIEANIARLKEKIKQRIKRLRDRDSDADDLKLFKVIFSINNTKSECVF